MIVIKQPFSEFDGLYADLTERIIGCAVRVHKTLGPGFVESECISFKRQMEVELTYAGQAIGLHRLDMLIDDKVVVKLKAKDLISDADKATTLSYLKATNKALALIINFGRSGIDIKRMGNAEAVP